ncbi:MAG TPA: hypothetical protein VK915_03435 [Gaiellaceae bacterium]|nr:hypothetical protein [Gaiellaceae bacterium]
MAIDPPSRCLLHAFAVLGLAAIVFSSTASSDLAAVIAYDAVALSVVLAILAGIWLHRPARALPWILVVLGFALIVADDVLWEVYVCLDRSPSRRRQTSSTSPPIRSSVRVSSCSPGARTRTSRRTRGRRGDRDLAASVLAWVFLGDRTRQIAACPSSSWRSPARS